MGLLVLLEGGQPLRDLQQEGPQLELREGLSQQRALADLLGEGLARVLPERVDAEVVGAEALLPEVLDPCVG